MRAKIVIALAAFLCLLVVAGVAWANGTPNINWWIIGGGGGHAEAGIYTLDAAIGQAVVGADTDGDYELCAGFWCGVVEAATPTPTATPTGTATPTATPTATSTAIATPTSTVTHTATPTGTSTTTSTPTSTEPPTPTSTSTATPTATSTDTPTPTPTGTVAPSYSVYLPVVLKSYP